MNGELIQFVPGTGLVAKDKIFYLWDNIQECLGNKCCVVDKCDAVKRGKCSVQVRYLNSLCSSIFTLYPKLDDVMLFEIGSQLLPLYGDLCRFQIYARSLDSVTETTRGGGLTVNPIFREIRETLKTIKALWRNIGIFVDNSPNPAFPLDSFGEGDLERGDPNYYNKISKEAKKRFETR